MREETTEEVREVFSRVSTSCTDEEDQCRLHLLVVMDRFLTDCRCDQEVCVIAALFRNSESVLSAASVSAV